MAAAEFDYIVVGAGSSGAALAARLGEAADKTTCVIEAGGQDTHPFIHVPSFVAPASATRSTPAATRAPTCCSSSPTSAASPASTWR